MNRDRETTARRAAEAFDVLGSELRTTILLALLDAGPLTFSELRDQVGVADSGRFNYHLDRLTGQFVRKVEDAYHLRYHGYRVAHAILAGTFTETTSFDPVPVEGACRACGEHTLEGAYVDERIRIQCGDCGERVLSVAFPPSAVVERTPEEALDAFERWSRRSADLGRDGVCPECAGRIDIELDPDPPDETGLSPLVRHECDACQWQNWTTVGSQILDHPDVLAFANGHDVEPRARPYWSNDYLVTNRHIEVRSRDPWRIDVTVAAEDVCLVLTLDGDMDVIETATSQ